MTRKALIDKSLSGVVKWLGAIVLILVVAIVFLVKTQISELKNCNEKADNTIKRVDIVRASDNNKRNDQSAMVELDDGRLVIAYSHFGESSRDDDKSSIYYQISTDNGNSWSAEKELVEAINLGSYVPSFFKKPDGNILMVFFVRDSDAPYKSSIWQIEFSADLSSSVSKAKIILPASGYFPIASDRLFFDKKSNLLLMPYPFLVEGPATSTLSNYKTKILVSNNYGDNWTDSGVIIDGFRNEKGFGGALEPGIFENKDKITLYSRNMTDKIGACNLIWNGSNYEKGEEYHLEIATWNAQSTIKYSELLRGWIATYTRLNKTAGSPRSQIDIAFSDDAITWKKVFTVDDIEQVGGFMVNEPNIFIRDNMVFISYSIATKPGNYYDLKIIKLPMTIF